VIDLHTHLLPGLDDGPSDEPGALELARAAVAAGTRAVVATPHVDHVYGVDPGSLPAAVEAMRSLLARRNVPLEVHVGAEVAITRLPELTSSELETLTLGGGGYLLLECPRTSIGDLLETVVLGAVAGGRGVVLAHPERSRAFIGRPDRLADLVRQGVRVQITAASLAGRFGRVVQRSALDLMRARLVHAIASDAHDASRRPPLPVDMFGAAERLLPGIRRNEQWWTEISPAAILAGEDPGEPPPLGVRRQLLPRRRRSS
jgi:protein-tyrosine phosphatase